jgi:multidrug resistance efflux pump
MPESKQKLNRYVIGVAVFILIVIGGGVAALAYLGVSSKTVSIDKSQIAAPVINLSPTQGGVLRTLNVAAGQRIAPNTIVAQVGVELIKSTSGGLVIATNGDVGSQVPAGQPVVEMIDPSSLRVVGQIDENKGLSRIKVGDPVSFTVDAFGGTSFAGVVDEISPTSNQSGIVFNISDQRSVQQFDIKVRFDTALYPQLKNGMSARMSIYVE